MNFATTSSSSLVAGNTYWFAASTVGLNGTGFFTVGAHTQNSGGINDSGTFWYSNSPAGLTFDGQNRTPEMAFTVTEGAAAVPEPATWALMLLGFGMTGFAMRKRSAVRTAVSYV